LKKQIIPYARQSIDASDIRAVTRVLKSDFLTQGPEIEAFERDFAKFCGAKHAVACSSATAGLHMSAMVLGMGPGDLWWTSPNTFCATADAALRCGAEVDFVDIEWGTYNMNLGLLEDRLKQAAQKNRLPKVVAPVHFAGNPVDMEFLERLRRRYGFKVVEDAAHATGAELRNERVGSCKWSDLCVFSFHAVKIITTGEGGMVTTNSKRIYEKLCRLRTHGISRDGKHQAPYRKKPWYYEKLELGNHYRMTDFQAALGRSQLKKIGSFQIGRERVAKEYDKTLVNLPLDLPRQTTGARSSWHLYPVCLQGSGPLRDRVLKQLRKDGINANLHYLPVPMFQFYRTELRKRQSSCPEARKFSERAISLPIYPNLSHEQQLTITRRLFRAVA
jgi:UDP-4-amino-4,6-dideoxy-N-acetyl-beta-L-altrosamine transaminase